MDDGNGALIPPAITAACGDEDLRHLRWLVQQAGFRMKVVSASPPVVAIRPGKHGRRLIELRSLTNSDSSLRPDATGILTEMQPVAEIELAQRVVDEYLGQNHRLDDAGGPLQDLEWRLLTEPDPGPALRELAATFAPLGIQLFRMQTTLALYYRDAIWRLLDRVDRDDLTLSEYFRLGDPGEHHPGLGHHVSLCTLLICAPLVASQQPYGVMFTTFRHAEIVGVLAHGPINSTATMARSRAPVDAPRRLEEVVC